jgi:hypothetical protein
MQKHSRHQVLVILHARSSDPQQWSLYRRSCGKADRRSHPPEPLINTSSVVSGSADHACTSVQTSGRSLTCVFGQNASGTHALVTGAMPKNNANPCTERNTPRVLQGRALFQQRSPRRSLEFIPRRKRDKTIRNSDFANMATNLLRVALGLPFACSAPSRAAALLTPMTYTPLPVGSVIPDGWLRLQLGILCSFSCIYV